MMLADALKGLAGMAMRTKEEATTTITVMMVHDDTADTCANGASVLHQNVSWTSRLKMQWTCAKTLLLHHHSRDVCCKTKHVRCRYLILDIYLMWLKMWSVRYREDSVVISEFFTFHLTAMHKLITTNIMLDDNAPF